MLETVTTNTKGDDKTCLPEDFCMVLSSHFFQEGNIVPKTEMTLGTGVDSSAKQKAYCRVTDTLMPPNLVTSGPVSLYAS